MNTSVFEDDPFSFAPASGYCTVHAPDAVTGANSDSGSAVADDDLDVDSSEGTDAGCDGDEHLLEHILATRLAAEFGPDSDFARPLSHGALAEILRSIAERHQLEVGAHTDALTLEATLERRLALEVAADAHTSADIFAPVAVAAASADLALLRALRGNNYTLGIAPDADEFQYRDWNGVVEPLEQYSKLETLPLATALGVSDLNATPDVGADASGENEPTGDAPPGTGSNFCEGVVACDEPCAEDESPDGGEKENDEARYGPPAIVEDAAQWLMEQGEFSLKDTPTTRFMRSRRAVLFSVAVDENREQLHARLLGSTTLGCHLDSALGDAAARVIVGYVGRDPLGIAAFLPTTARQFADAMAALPDARPSCIRRDDLLPFFKWNRRRNGASAGSPSGDVAAAGLTTQSVARMLRRRTGIYLAPRALRTYVYQDANLLRSYLAGAKRPLGQVPFVCIDIEAARMRLDAIPVPVELAAYGGCVDGSRPPVSYHTFVHPGFLPPGQTTDAQLSCGFVPGSHGIPARAAAFLRTDYQRVAAELRRLFVDGANDFVFVFKGNNAVDINALRVVFAIGAALQAECPEAEDDAELYVPEIHAFDVATLARALQLDPTPVQRSLHRPLSYEASVAHARWYEGRAELSRLSAQRAGVAASLDSAAAGGADAQELRGTMTALDEITATMRADVAADEATWRAEEDPAHARHACWFHRLETTRARAPGLHCALLDSVLLFDVVTSLVRAAPEL